MGSDADSDLASISDGTSVISLDDGFDISEGSETEELEDNEESIKVSAESELASILDGLLEKRTTYVIMISSCSLTAT
jgi:hypothetical protein